MSNFKAACVTQQDIVSRNKGEMGRKRDEGMASGRERRREPLLMQQK